MSNEEKEAVGKLETLIQYLSVWNENFTIVPADMKYLVPIFNLIAKQSKEIEELKKKNEPQSDCAEPIERTEEMVNMRWVNHNYILKTESEQRERKAYIKGTNDADKLCNKKWEDKIKAKIEEVHYKMIGHQDLREAVKETLESLSEKEN